VSKLDDFRARIGGVRIEDAPKMIQAKSRDFYWYSPVLKRKLDHVTADLVVCPKDEDEVLAVLAAAHALEIPVTPRGGGTGNYGQAMPLAGGVVLDLRGLDGVREIGDGFVRAGAGMLVADIDAALAPHGAELRMHPSTKETATIGGFIAGGSGGVGSIRWGALRDPGNILAARVATMEASPRIVELTGRDVNQVQHAYGVNGVILDATMPTTKKENWVEIILAHPDWLLLNAFADRLGRMHGLLLKELATVQAPAPHRYFKRHAKFFEEGDGVLIAMAAPNAVAALLDLAAREGLRLAYRSDEASEADLKTLPHAHHLCWNHTTLRALRVDPEITFLQIQYPAENRLACIRRTAEAFPDEIIGHNEFMRADGALQCAGLAMVRFTTEERLREIVRAHDEMGCLMFSPHHYTVEEGGMKQTDPLHIDMKRRHDPKGLLNPGKMIGWEDPDFDFSRDYAYPGLAPAP
jgi:FAD/FMN-containing dehydrogenase